MTRSRRATIRLQVRSTQGAEILIDAVVDTAFSGSLALSRGAAAALKSRPSSRSRLQLADGTHQYFDTHSIGVHWMNSWKMVRASVLGDESLIGIRLLDGHELKIAVTPGGAVEIIPLP